MNTLPPQRPYRTRKRSLALALVSALFATAAVCAEITQTDVLVAGRAIGFVEKFGRGELSIGIVVASDSAQSVQQANDLRATLGSQFRVGNLVLKPVVLRLNQLADADVDLFFLTDGVGAEATKVAEVGKARKIPCITFDLSQVRNGVCTIGVQSRPRIEVFVNRKAAEESNTKFSNVFRLMITEF